MSILGKELACLEDVGASVWMLNVGNVLKCFLPLIFLTGIERRGSP